MQDIRWKAFWLLSSAIALCITLWAIYGLIIALSAFSAILLLYLIAHIVSIRKLQVWLKNPDPETVPEGSGVWQSIFTSLFQNQRKHKRAESDLISSLEGFKRATSALPDGIVILNRRNEIEWCNPPAEEQLGIDLAQDINYAIHNFVRYGEFINYLQAEYYGEPIQLKSLRHPELTLQLQLIPFGIEQKLLICRDVTAQEKTDTMRRDFIANVSHELRTPLTVVGGFLETLSDTEGLIPESSRRYFDMMMDQASRMRVIIEDLLTLSRIESNMDAPEDKIIKMPEMLKQIKNDAIALSNGRHKITMKAEKSLNLMGSRDELLSAFSNLVSNAVRYTPDGGHITILWYSRNSEAVFGVQDTGIGIEQQHIDRLTERFYRVDRGRSRETGGTGLGLAIVKHIVSRHKAKLEIKSEFGIGSTFSIVFPDARVLRKIQTSAS